MATKKSLVRRIRKLEARSEVSNKNRKQIASDSVTFGQKVEHLGERLRFSKDLDKYIEDGKSMWNDTWYVRLEIPRVVMDTFKNIQSELDKIMKALKYKKLKERRLGSATSPLHVQYWVKHPPYGAANVTYGYPSGAKNAEIGASFTIGSDADEDE